MRDTDRNGNRRHRREDERRLEPQKQVPAPSADGRQAGAYRSLKFLWAAAVSVLLALSLTLDRSSPLLPLVHRAIDFLQAERAPLAPGN